MPLKKRRQLTGEKPDSDKIFSLQEENWLKEAKIDIVSLREAYLNNNPAQIQIIPFQNSNVTNDENFLRRMGCPTSIW